MSNEPKLDLIFKAKFHKSLTIIYVTDILKIFPHIMVTFTKVLWATKFDFQIEGVETPGHEP